MKLITLLKTFRNDEDGAVTVDWVVLTAAIVGLGVAIMASVTTSVTTVSDGMGTRITDALAPEASGG